MNHDVRNILFDTSKTLGRCKGKEFFKDFANFFQPPVARPKKQDYERAKRLYQACLASGVDNGYFEKRLTKLERVWKVQGGN